MRKRIYSLDLLLLLGLGLGLALPALAAMDASEGLEKISIIGANGKTLYGYADQNGNTVIPAEYERLGDFHEGLAAAYQDGKWGFINAVGQTIIPFKYDDVSDFTEAGAMVKMSVSGLGSKWGVIDTSGKTIVSVIYDDLILPEDVNAVYYDRVAVAQYDKNGDLKWGTPRYIPLIFDEIDVDFKRGIRVGIKNDAGVMKYGLFVNVSVDYYYKWEETLSTEYDAIEAVETASLLIVAKDGKWGCLTPKGEPVIPVEYDWIGTPFVGYQKEKINGETVRTSYTYIPVGLGENYGCFDETGTVVLEVKYSQEHLYSQINRLKGNNDTSSSFGGGSAAMIRIAAIAVVVVIIAIGLVVFLKGYRKKKNAPMETYKIDNFSENDKKTLNIVSSKQVDPAATVSGPKFCPSCSKPLTPGVKFCPECGQSLQSKED